MMVVHFAVVADIVLVVCSCVCFCVFAGVDVRVCIDVGGRSRQCWRAFAAVLAVLLVVKAADSQGGFALVFYCGVCM